MDFHDLMLRSLHCHNRVIGPESIEFGEVKGIGLYHSESQPWISISIAVKHIRLGFNWNYDAPAFRWIVSGPWTAIFDSPGWF